MYLLMPINYSIEKHCFSLSFSASPLSLSLFLSLCALSGLALWSLSGPSLVSLSLVSSLSGFSVSLVSLWSLSSPSLFHPSSCFSPPPPPPSQNFYPCVTGTNERLLKWPLLLESYCLEPECWGWSKIFVKSSNLPCQDYFSYSNSNPTDKTNSTCVYCSMYRCRETAAYATISPNIG